MYERFGSEIDLCKTVSETAQCVLCVTYTCTHTHTHTHIFLSFKIPQAVLAGQQVCSNYHLCCLRPWRAPNCLAGAEELGIMNLPYTTAQPPERPRFGRPRSHSM